MYEPRTYRNWAKDDDLVSFEASVRETDLYIRAKTNLKSKAEKSILKHREPLEKYIAKNPVFFNSLSPVNVEPGAPKIVKMMADAGRRANVGPMAAVAGAVAELVGRDLLEYSPEIIVENGGDIFLKIEKTRFIGVFAGTSPFTGKLRIEVVPEDTPAGICTSSGTVGHSLSFGKADAAVICARSAALADAAATAVCNEVKTAEDIEKAIELGRKIKGLNGILIIKGDKIGAWGNIKLHGV